MSGPLLVPLCCPKCGSDLDGGPHALIFLCLPCGLAIHASDPRRPYPLSFAAPLLRQAAPDLYAPFWKVDGTFSWTTSDKQKERVYANQRPLGALFVPAFWSPKAAYYDNLTLRYALQGGPQRLDGAAGPVLDGARPPEVLGELARLTWLAYLDRAADVTGVDGRFQVDALAYAAIPFYRDGSRFLDGILGVPVPEAYFSG